ncbi:prenyltransferase/squalene oxidase repeat-containing protein [uncultured Croceitalea sp.]|uniref:prenyltransferase/squalene oxidase repeat-containing protein n=1 Tax=uncultured Croceitalea sp. TaxID=1798908 RepID=UPI00374E7BB2
MVITVYNYNRECDFLVKETVKDAKSLLQSNGYESKLIDIICNSHFIEENPDYYFYYPYLFREAFGINNKQILKKLSLAGFFTYVSVIHSDSILDNEIPLNKFQSFLISNIAQDESVKLLSDLFTLNSKFWKYWTKRKLEFIKAYKIERSLKGIECFKDFEELADYKATFGKIALDSLELLTKRSEYEKYLRILESHKSFYVAFQILDDIADYNEDFHNNQFNISKYYLYKQKPEVSEKSLEEQRKDIFLDGVADMLYTKCLNYLNKAFKIVDDLDLPLWKYEIQSLYNTTISHKLNVQGYTYYKSILADSTNKTLSSNNHKKSIRFAENYILKKMDSDGYWYEFLNDSGLSDVWATAFISYFLINSKDLNIKKVRSFLLSKRCSNSFLWSYNSSWIPDADSTSFVLLVLFKMGIDIKVQDLDYWFKYQNNDGGFSTYNDTDVLIASLNTKESLNVSGWTSSHFCVSTFAYYTMILLGIKNERFNKLKEYISVKLKDESFETYWWTKDYYSLSFLLQAYYIEGDFIHLNICKAKLYEMISTDKTFFKNEFYMGLILNSICEKEFVSDFHEIKERIVSELLENQLVDGSWKSNKIMRMPAPNMLNLSNEKITWKVDTRGTNIILEDFNRLFTTSVCLSALKKYDERK